jgi:hypothetical protein
MNVLEPPSAHQWEAIQPGIDAVFNLAQLLLPTRSGKKPGFRFSETGRLILRIS